MAFTAHALLLPQTDEHGSVVDQAEGAVAQQAQQEGAGEPFDHIERQIQVSCRL